MRVRVRSLEGRFMAHQLIVQSLAARFNSLLQVRKLVAGLRLVVRVEVEVEVLKLRLVPQPAHPLGVE